MKEDERMRELVYIAVTAAVFVFGYVVMGKLDELLGREEDNHETENHKTDNNK